MIIAMAAMAILAISCGSSSKSAQDLAGKTFIITELNGTPITSGTEEPANIVFEDGRANAFVGYNRIFAMYTELADGKLKMEQGGSTRMLAGPESREDEFIAAFNKLAGYKMDGNDICFLDAEGNVLFSGKAE